MRQSGAEFLPSTVGHNDFPVCSIWSQQVSRCQNILMERLDGVVSVSSALIFSV